MNRNNFSFAIKQKGLFKENMFHSKSAWSACLILQGCELWLPGWSEILTKWLNYTC